MRRTPEQDALLKRLIASQKDRSRVAPIKLGNEVTRLRGEADVLSFEAVGEQAAAPEAEYITTEAWVCLLTAVGFEPAEREFLIANRLDRIPRRALPAYLGWDARFVESTRVATQRKLEALNWERPDIAHYRRAQDASYTYTLLPSTREETVSGKRTWSMRLAREPFEGKRRRIVEAPEPKRPLITPVLNGCSKDTILRFTYRELHTMETLEQQLAAAHLTSTRIWSQKSEADEKIEKLQSELGKAKAELHTAEEDALLLGKQVSPRLTKRVQEIEAAIPAAYQRAETCDRAYRRACDEIEKIHGEIQAGRRARMVIDLAPVSVRLSKSLDTFIQDALEANAILCRYGAQQSGGRDLFLALEGDDQTSQSIHLGQKLSLVRAALQVAEFQLQRGYRNAS